MCHMSWGGLPEAKLDQAVPASGGCAVLIGAVCRPHVYHLGLPFHVDGPCSRLLVYSDLATLSSRVQFRCNMTIARLWHSVVVVAMVLAGLLLASLGFAAVCSLVRHGGHRPHVELL